MPRISRQLSSKKSSIGKRFAIVAVVALFFYNAQVIIGLHQTIFGDLPANSTQYQLHDNTEFSGSVIKQRNYTSTISYRSNSNMKNTGMTGTHFGMHTILTREQGQV